MTLDKHEVPAALEDAIERAARSVIGDAPLATAALVRAILDRSRRYTSERERLAAPTDRTGDLAARAMFFTIADALKIAIPLRELVGRGALPARRPLRVLDLGAGCGAMTLGLLATLRDVPVEVLAIDRDRDALRIAAAAARDLAGVTITTRTDDVATARLGEADLVLAGSVLNELPPERALGVVERALAVLPDDGALIVVEPALRETSRALHEIRDSIVARGRGDVFAPCTRRGTPCTALVDPRDWCHEDRPLVLPRRTAELARLTHLRDAGMRFAYLVLRRQPLALADDPGAWRVVSAPFVAKGKRELIGCGERGRTRLRLLKRNRSEANRAFEDADRGDVLAIEGEPEGDRLEVEEHARVARLPPLG